MKSARRLTLEKKKLQCAHCVHCDKVKLRQGREHCKSEYVPRNGHCGNFVQEKK